MECPVCKQKSKPLCPFFNSCKYRRVDPRERVFICWNNPTICSAYREKTKREPQTEEEEEFNPSRRDNDVHM